MTASWATSGLLSLLLSLGGAAVLPWSGPPSLPVTASVGGPLAPTADDGEAAPGHAGGLGLGAAPMAADPAPVGAWAWPVAAPHTVLHRFDPPAQRWGSGHRGVDLATPPGALVVAPADGVVTFAGTLVDRGVLVVAHSGGLRSTFEPVSGLVAVGALVHRGQPVATIDVASFGVGHCAPLSCLHWGLIRAETYLDPLWFVGGRVVLLPLP